MPDLMSWVQLGRWHDLDVGDERAMAMTELSELCNLLIHSWIFAPSFDPDTGLMGLFFNSDRTRHERLFFIDIAVLTRAFRSLGARPGITPIVRRVRQRNLDRSRTRGNPRHM